MEAMRGPRWKSRVEQENAEFIKALVNKEDVPATAQRFKANSAETETLLTYDVELGKTKIQVTEKGSALSWKWDASNTEYSLVGDLDVTNTGVVIYAKDVTAGGHHYEICAVSKEKTLWSFDGRGNHGLSSDVAILGGRVYCLEAASPLQYKWLVSIDVKTGKDRRVHYEEHEVSASLSLIRGENKCLFLFADNAGKQALYHVGLRGGVRRLDEEGTVFFPIGYGPRSTEPCYFMRKTRISLWEARGGALRSLKLPEEFYGNGIDLVNIREGLVVHRNHGRRHVEKGGRVMSFWGDIEQNLWTYWNGGGSDLRLTVPGQTPVRGLCSPRGLVFDRPDTLYGANLKHGKARSADGTSVGWLGVWSCSRKPVGLIVVAYGAYGLTTPTDTTRWRPYIEKGFAVGFAFIRGGGDHNDAWAQEGRLAGKERGAEDFEACVRELQAASGVKAQNTCVFGRSAGGYLMGLFVLRNPRGELARCVYTEAPYVDVLQTSSNVELPLTVLEYLEFGDPAHSIADFEMLLRLSPVGATRGAPGVFVLCRVGLNDRQVYAYESVKWMDALRIGGGEKKILFLTKGIGHNAYGDLVAKERAEDFLILCDVLCRQ
jgi:dipeptidyl aminopeptidase/acylaminoacyl peptidase